MTNNNDYEWHEAREASDRALEAAVDDVGDRAPNTSHRSGPRALEATSHASEAPSHSFASRAPEYVENLTFALTNSTFRDKKIAIIKNALNKVLYSLVLFTNLYSCTLACP